MKISSPRVLLAGCVFALCPVGQASEKVWYDAEAAANDPLVILSRVHFGFEYAGGDSPRAKIIPGITWALGEKTGRHDWAAGIELPLLINLPNDGPEETGMGDFKIRLSHSWLDNETLLLGSYFDAEFDTAASNVQSMGNQRTQFTLGSGFIRNFGDGWAMGAGFQYGWSVDAGTTNGTRSEWEYRVGIRKKFADAISATLVYKGTVNVARVNQYTSSLEPSLAWSPGSEKNYSLYFACEAPLESGREDFTAKLSIGRVS